MPEMTPEQRAYLELSEKYFSLVARIEAMEANMETLARDNRSLMKKYYEDIEYRK